MRQIATVTSKGQVTIPVEMRRRLGLSPSDKVESFMDDKDEIKLRPARVRSFLDLMGTLPSLGRETDDFDDLIKEAFEEGVDKWLAEG